MSARAFYYKCTDGIRVSVRPVFLPERSHAPKQQFVFAYFVRIENIGTESAQLRSRRWLIHDSIGEETVVEGEGVVGVFATCACSSVAAPAQRAPEYIIVGSSQSAKKSLERS